VAVHFDYISALLVDHEAALEKIGVVVGQVFDFLCIV